MQKSANKVVLTDRDCKILGFLWRWRYISTAAIAAKYFSKASTLVAYVRLHQLRRAGYVNIQQIASDNRFAWSITKKGFKFIVGQLPGLNKVELSSKYPSHDVLVSAVHIGAWLEGLPTGCKLFSERQLVCYHPEHYPSWIPSCLDHQPDGFWQLPDSTTIALELQKSRQSKKWWSKVGAYYSLSDKIHKVIWVLGGGHGSNGMAKHIESISEVSDSGHFIFRLTDLKKQGWNATCINREDEGLRLHKLLHINPIYSGYVHMGQALFDFRKRPIISAGSANQPKR